MYPRIAIALIACCLIFSCAKEKSTEPDQPAPTDSFQPISSGSVWHYRDSVQGDFTLTATENDTLIDALTYRQFNNELEATGQMASAYFGQKDDAYYALSFFPTIPDIPILYLKEDAAAGATWTQDITYSGQQAELDFKLVDKGGSKTVNEHPYTDVTHVNLEVFINLPVVGRTPTGIKGDLFVARGVGVIYVIVYTNQSVSASVSLMSYTLQ